MKITIPRAALLSALQTVQPATAPKGFKPVLASVKITTEGDDGLSIQATDLEVGIRYEIRGVNVKRPGVVCLPANRLVSILRETNDADVVIDGDEKSVTVRLTSGKYDLPYENPDEFPNVPIADEVGAYHEVTAGVLKTMLKRVAFAAEKRENTRYAVTGVLFETSVPDRLKLVSTDTKRLAIAEGPATSHASDEFAPAKNGVLVPLKAISLLEKNLTDDDERIRISFTTNDAKFQTERATIVTRLVEGKFPPYSQFLPKKMEHKFPISTERFATSIRQAAITSDDVDKRVDLLFASGKLTLACKGDGVGSSEVEMPVEEYDGKELAIAFDPRYLLDMLRVAEEPTIAVEITKECDRMVMRAGDSYLYLVVPMVG